MSPALLSTRAVSAIREGFDQWRKIVVETVPERTLGRVEALELMDGAYAAAMLAAAAVKNGPPEEPDR